MHVMFYIGTARGLQVHPRARTGKFGKGLNLGVACKLHRLRAITQNCLWRKGAGWLIQGVSL